MEKSGKLKTKRISSVNILIMVLLTMLVIFSIYFAILVFIRPPIFNIFGETGAYLPSSITGSIVISAGVAFVFSIILLIPEIPVRQLREQSGVLVVQGVPSSSSVQAVVTKPDLLSQSLAVQPSVSSAVVIPTVSTLSGF